MQGEQLIGIRNTDVSKISLAEQLREVEENVSEVRESYFGLLGDAQDNVKKEQFIKGICDTFQCSIGLAMKMGIEVKEVAKYWNTKHKGKLKEGEI